MIFIADLIGLTFGGSSTAHIYTQTIHRTTQSTQNNAQNNTMKQNTQSRTYITIRIHKHNNKKYIIYKIKQKHIYIYMCVCVCVCMYVCACVCLCVKYNGATTIFTI